jgi:radical SAM enzyme (TIGR01210 family)
MSEQHFFQRESKTESFDLEQVVSHFGNKIEEILALPEEDFILTSRGLLRTALISLRHKYGKISGEKTVHHFLPDPVDFQRENPLVVLGTGHCSYMEMGGCAMCSFGETAKRKLSQKEIDEALDFIIKQNDQYQDRAIFNINVIGSFFNDSELDPKMRQYIFEQIKKYQHQNKDKKIIFVTESRFEDIDEQKIKELRIILGAEIPIEIGFGVESTNDLVRESVIGKGLDPNWQKKLKMLQKAGIDYSLHIMFGSPFLNAREQVFDSMQSVKDCLKLAGEDDRVLLMIMNVKPGTLVDYLAKQGKYQLPTLSLAAETVLRLSKEVNPDELRKLSIFGLVFPEEFVEQGAKKVSVHNKLEQKIMDIFLNWRGTPEEINQLEKIYTELNESENLSEKLPPLDIERIKKDIVNYYLKILAKIYCDKEPNLNAALDKLEGVLDISSQMGGSNL